MTKISNGRYGKFSKLNEVKVLAFIPEGAKHDSIHEVFKTLKEKFHLDVDCYQSAETREEMGEQHFDMSFWNMDNNKDARKINTYFEYVLVSAFNRVGERKEDYLLKFDYENNKVIITNSKNENKTFKVIDLKQGDYLMKTTKTMIKFQGGIEAFYKEIVNQMHIGSCDNLCNIAYGLNKKYIEGVK